MIKTDERKADPMKKSKKQMLVEKLEGFEQQCDEFLGTLNSIKILNLNREISREEVLDVQSYDWKIFFNDLQRMIKNYEGDMGSDFERFILMVSKAVKYPDWQNISDLKVGLHGLKTSIEESEDEVAAEGIWAFMHPQIQTVSKRRFEDGYYADAVESAFKEVNSRVKRLYLQEKGTEKDGVDLMRAAFSPNDPVLQFEDLSRQTGKNIQQGYMEIFVGAMMGIRNPKAHANMMISEHEAVQRLMLASLLMSKIDEAVQYMGISE